MDAENMPQAQVNSRSLLLPYAMGLIAAMAAIQLVVAITGSESALIAGLLTAVVAVGIAVWGWRNHRKLAQVRFGFAIAHTIAYMAVMTSFNLHAMIRALSQSTQGNDAGQILAGWWFGATLVMGSLWGIGLLFHLVGSVLARGWED
ncbi:hypothetical protein [Glutamicibacter soli]